MSNRSRSRRVREPDPVRLPLPGQDPGREADWLARLTAEFRPASPTEAMWVEDVAWCCTNIEHIRAIIAAHKRCCLDRAYRSATATSPFVSDDASPEPSAEMLRLRMFAALGYTPANGGSFLGDASFGVLLGAVSEAEQQQMRALQSMLHEEMRERERVINQIHRVRRAAMTEAVAVLEAQGWRRLADDGNAGDEGAAEAEPVDRAPAGAEQE